MDEFQQFLINKLCDILKKVVENDWKISKQDVDLFKWYSKVLVTVGEIIKNDYKPSHIFT
jgi:hypothetical protein